MSTHFKLHPFLEGNTSGINRTLGQEVRKPIFHLKPADGALGSHMQAVRGAYKDFRQLAINIAQHVNLSLPPT